MRPAARSAAARRSSELQPGQRLAPPAQVRPRRQDAVEHGVDERPVEAGQLRRQRAAVGVDDAHVRRAEAADVLLELSRRPSFASTATTSPASIVAFPPGAAQRSSTRSPDREPTQWPASWEPML